MGVRSYKQLAAVIAYVSLVAAVVFQFAPMLLTRRGRRLLLSSWRRLTRWEFWPPWVFYPPLCLYVACLMIKYRSLTVFTAANPAIAAGGFVGESKFAI